MNHESIVLAFFCSIPFLLASMMKKAAKDKSFMERTMKCAEDFSFSDSEVQGEW